MIARFVRRLGALFVLTVGPNLPAAELVATGISIPFFNDAGRLTHRLVARSALRAGDLQEMRSIEIHYFAPDDPGRTVQKVEAADATWDERKERLSGRGRIVVSTPDSRLSGEGFEFAVATSRVDIHRAFMLTNPEMVITSDRATIELVVDQANGGLNVRDVKRCEAIGNLHIVIQPAFREKYRVKEAFSDLAIYEGVKRVVTLPHPTRTLQVDGGEGRVQTLTIKLE